MRCEGQNVNISMQKEGYKSVKELLEYNQNKASIPSESVSKLVRKIKGLKGK